MNCLWLYDEANKCFGSCVLSNNCANSVCWVLPLNIVQIGSEEIGEGQWLRREWEGRKLQGSLAEGGCRANICLEP